MGKVPAWLPRLPASPPGRRTNSAASGGFAEPLGRDLVYALRTMRSNPGFTATVILTLGLGIGSTTAIFTLVNGVLLRPLPFPQPERLVSISEILGERPSPYTYVGDYSSFRDHNRTLTQIAGYNLFAANFSRSGDSERVIGGLATRSLFELLGVRFMVGRNFLSGEDAPGSAPAAILSDWFWRSRFGADPLVVASSLMLDGRSYNIVGVVPRGFLVPGSDGGASRVALWLPFAIAGKHAARDEIMLRAVGRLSPRVTLPQAQADLDSLQQVKLRRGARKRVALSDWQREITRDAGRSLRIFLCAAGFVLLIACVNVANLLLTCASARGKEIALRRALGAGRARVLRQLLTESGLMGLLGALLGLAFAWWGKDLLIDFLAPNLPALDPIALDWRVLVFNIGLGIATGLAFGLVPGLQMSGIDLSQSLKESGRGNSDGGNRLRWRGLLVVTEVAVAMVLVSGAALFLQSFLRLRGVDGGYRPDHVLSVELDLTGARYQKPAEQSGFFRLALERIERLPGTVSAGITTSPPFGLYSAAVNEISLEGRGTVAATIGVAAVSPDYFRTLAIPLIRGRYFAATDRDGAPSAVLVNESFARQLFPGADCVGKRLENWDRRGDWMTIVGVVGDTRRSPEDETEPEVYASYLQTGGTHMSFLIRTAVDPMSMAAAVRSQIAAVDETQPAHGMTTLEQSLNEYLTPRRVKLLLVGVLAALALSLGVVGVYGVLSCAVRRRTQEIGVRLALGAEPRLIVGLILRRGLAQVGAGVIAGLAASRALNRLISSELWGVSATDPWTLVAVTLVLAASGFAACLLPALRAARVDPVRCLRCE